MLRCLKFTENVCRAEKIFKHTVGRLKEIVLTEEMQAQVQIVNSWVSYETSAHQTPPPTPVQEESCATELILPGLPEGCVVEVRKGHEDPYRCFLKLGNIIWYKDKSKQAAVRRCGFQLVPGFAGTVHAYCGDSLEKCKGDLLEWYKLPTLEMMQRGYVIRSRVSYIDKCMLVRPYSPAPFNQGSGRGKTSFFYFCNVFLHLSHA